MGIKMVKEEDEEEGGVDGFIGECEAPEKNERWCWRLPCGVEKLVWTYVKNFEDGRRRCGCDETASR